jgi:hypothetical protein
MESPGENIPYSQREDLTSQEKEAIAVYLENWEYVNDTLRKPKENKEFEEWQYFPNLVYHIDRAISKSSPGQSRLLFRGIHGDFAERALFCLAIPPGSPEEPDPGPVVAHFIQDRGYTSFSEDLDLVLEGDCDTGGRKVILVHRPREGAAGLALDEHGEVLFPRDTLWITTGHSYRCCQGCRAVFVSVDNYGAR